MTSIAFPRQQYLIIFSITSSRNVACFDGSCHLFAPHKLFFPSVSMFLILQASFNRTALRCPGNPLGKKHKLYNGKRKLFMSPHNNDQGQQMSGDARVDVGSGARVLKAPFPGRRCDHHLEGAVQ